MEKVARVFKSKDEADKADREYYRSLTPDQRIAIVLQLVDDFYGPEPRLERVCRVIKLTEVEYLVVGAYALAFHGHPRLTGDIDFFVRNSTENAARLMDVLEAFGFGSLGIKTEDLTHGPGVIQLGYPPRRIDILTEIEAVTFDEAWHNRVVGKLDGMSVNYISVEDFKRNKLSVGRPKDLADAAELD